MSQRRSVTKRGKYIIAMAYELAGVRNLCFTFDAFCAHTKIKKNRHTRTVLEMMVEAGALRKERVGYPGSRKWVYRYDAVDVQTCHEAIKEMLNGDTTYLTMRWEH